MLADRFGEFFESMLGDAAVAGNKTGFDQVSGMIEKVRRAARFRLDDQAVGLVRQAMGRPDALIDSSPYLAWPATTTWIEFQLYRPMVGVLFNSEDAENTKRGHVSIALWAGEFPLMFYGKSRLGEAEPFTWHDAGEQINAFRIWERNNKTQLTDKELLRFRDLLGRTVLGALALLNSPKTVRVVEANLSQLNRARVRGRKRPLLSHKVVTVDLAKVERLLREGDAAEDGPGAPRQQHFVRWHLRLVRGVLYPVRPHWRGDPSLGIKAPPAYQLTAKEGVTHGSPPP